MRGVQACAAARKETVESVTEQMWRLLPSIAKLHADVGRAEQTVTEGTGTHELSVSPFTVGNAEELVGTDDLPPVLSAPMVPLEEVRQLAGCLYMACHSNPVEADVESAVDTILGKAEYGAVVQWGLEDFVKFLERVQTDWMVWAEKDKKWLAVTERQHAQVLKDLFNSVTQDVEPFALLPRDKVLTMCSTIVRTKKLETLFKSFVTFENPPEYAAVYDKLWELLLLIQRGDGEGDTGEETPLGLECFTKFVQWFFFSVFKRVTEETVAVAAKTIWVQHLNPRGVMLKRHFVDACRYMCKFYKIGEEDVEYFDRQYALSEAAVKDLEDAPRDAFFQQRQDSQGCRILSDVHEHYVSEDLDESNWMEKLSCVECNSNRIFVHGRRGVGKTTVSASLAKRLNCVHLDVMELVFEAVANTADPLGSRFRECVDSNAAIPSSLISAVVRRKVCSSETRYRGYVFSEIPSFSCEDDTKLTAFLTDCGIVDELVPTTFVCVDCEDDFYAERLEASMKNREAEYAEEAKLLEEEMKEAASRDELLTKINVLKETLERLNAEEDGVSTAPPNAPGGGDAPPAPEDVVDGAPDPEALNQELGKLLEDQATMEEREKEEAPLREARVRRINDLKLRRLVIQSLCEVSGGDSGVSSINDLPCFEENLKHAHLLGRCLTIDCVSTAEEATTYVVDTLLLQRCAIPWAVTDKIETKNDEKQPSKAETERLVEEFLGSNEIPTSHRWKHFCPVTYAETRVLVEGSVDNCCVFRQQLFYLASEECLLRFKKNPSLYLGTIPLNREPILLLSTVAPRDAEHLPHTVVQEVTQRLHEKLDLTLMEFNTFASLWESHWELKKKRAETLQTRAKYEAVERKLRADRLKKRLAQERRMRARLNSQKGSKSKKANAMEVELPEEEYKGWELANEKSESGVTAVDKVVGEKLDRQNTFVPILVHSVDGEQLAGFDRLFSENVLPQVVVVLQYAQPTAEEEGGEDSRTVRRTIGGGGTATPLLPQEVVLNKLEEASDAIVGTGGVRLAGDVPPMGEYSIHRIVVNGKDASELVNEIIQAVCPGMDPVENGTVDETLQEIDEDDDESEELYSVTDPELKPGKGFLNQFGSTLEFCPVTLCEKRLLVRGRNDQCVQFRGKLYTFTSEEAKERFEVNPLRYVRPSYPVPPCRMWIVGLSKSGKKTLASSLGKEYGVPHFQYSRKLFDVCIEAALKPGGAAVGELFIPEQDRSNPYIEIAVGILDAVRAFDPEQERRMKLREEAEKELQRRQEAAENGEEEEDELDEEAEARLQELLDFEPESEHERQLRLSEAYLKVAGCVTHIEPFASRGYIMVCPPFSDGDMDILFSMDAVPELAIRFDLSDDVYRTRNTTVKNNQGSLVNSAELLSSPDDVSNSSEDAEVLKKLELEAVQKEREVAKWRRRHIGADDPESVEGETVREEEEVTRGLDNSHTDDHNPSLEENLILEKEAVEEFVDAVSERLVPVVALNGDLSQNAVFRIAVRRLGRALEHRQSLMHAVEVVRLDDAARMLESGEATLSYFRNTDPVALYDARHGWRRVCKWMPDGVVLECEHLTPSECTLAVPGAMIDDKEEFELHEYEETVEGGSLNSPLNHLGAELSDSNDSVGEEMSERDSELMEELADKLEAHRRREQVLFGQRAALFRGRLYFFDSDATLLRYKQNPLLFVQQSPPLPPIMSKPVISVFDKNISFTQEGDTVVRKRCTAEQVAFNLGFIFVSLPKLLTWAALRTSMLSLSKAAISAAIKGSVDDELVARLLVHRLNAADAKQKGVVLHNLPRSFHQYQLLLECGLKVDKVFQLSDCYSDVACLIKSMATAEGPLTATGESVAVMTEMCESIDVFTRNEARAVLCRLMGLPVDIHNSYHTVADIETHLSPYRWFCPYSWSLHGNLVDQKDVECRHAALYLGQYYFFSSAEYLQRFLLWPGEVTVLPGFKPLPDVIPTRIQIGIGCALELEGCCPVLLYDTREKKGLRGVLEPEARKGDLACVVEYNSCYYALLNEEAVSRFLMRPWQYVPEAKLPPSRKVPLAEGRTMSTIDEEEFIRRALYDPVAHALIAVAEARPKFYGLSLEESALKFVALHMKCFNTMNSALQAEQYKKKFESFQRQSTLYRTIPAHSHEINGGKTFSKLCDEWESARYCNVEDLCSYYRCETKPV
uniref:Adenylate kinase n=1 Tax=Trypanosoma congolense (strain IL3000) TaxID=1068625 RepID=G0UX63_TRYCI|nr:conserved hypothetical protein [Trypanosoma congolense IL3000]